MLQDDVEGKMLVCIVSDGILRLRTFWPRGSPFVHPLRREVCSKNWGERVRAEDVDFVASLVPVQNLISVMA